MEIKGRGFGDSCVRGEILFSEDPISFLGGVDPDSGVVIEKGHSLKDKKISNKVLVFPKGKGSTVGSYVLYQLKKNNNAPKAIVNEETEPIVAVGAIISEIPLVDQINLSDIPREGEIEVDASKGIIKY